MQRGHQSPSMHSLPPTSPREAVGLPKNNGMSYITPQTKGWCFKPQEDIQSVKVFEVLTPPLFGWFSLQKKPMRNTFLCRFFRKEKKHTQGWGVSGNRLSRSAPGGLRAVGGHSAAPLIPRISGLPGDRQLGIWGGGEMGVLAPNLPRFSVYGVYGEKIQIGGVCGLIHFPLCQLLEPHCFGGILCWLAQTYPDLIEIVGKMWAHELIQDTQKALELNFIAHVAVAQTNDPKWPLNGTKTNTCVTRALQQCSLTDTFCPFETWLFPPK